MRARLRVELHNNPPVRIGPKVRRPTKGGVPVRGINGPTCWLVIGLCVFFLPSCARRAAHVEPSFSLPQEFSLPGSAPIPDMWWTALEDDHLDLLVQQALKENFSLRTAWDRLDQARAIAARSGANLWPSFDGLAGISRNVSKTKEFGRNNTTDYLLGATAAYEVDLWGRVRSTRDAARFDAFAAQEDLQAAAITLTAEVGRTWYQLIEQQGQLDLLDDQTETNEKYLDLITLRFRRGQVSAADVLQQRQLVESTRGERALVESNLRVLEHQLSVLIGQPPGTLEIPVQYDLPSLPPTPQTGLPVELIRRRPDIRSAELRIRAADRRVAAAIAARFPEIGLTIQAETSAEKIRDLFDNWLASIAANMVAPLFDGGERRAEVENTKAILSERLNDYSQSVLESLKEVEDAVYQETKQAEYVASLKEQLELSGKATTQTLENYTKGTTDFTRYLTTLLAHQRLQRTYLQARRELVLFRIDVYRALAGGWSLSQPPSARISEMRVTGNDSDTGG